MKFVKLPKMKEGRAHSLDKVVFSSRVRLTRNLEGLKFPAFLSDKDKFDIDKKLSQHIQELIPDHEVNIEDMNDMNRDRLMFYYGNHLITEEFVKSGRILAYETGGEWVILLNEDDHFRIFSLFTGYGLPTQYAKISEVLNQIEKKVDFAYDERWGYLTSSILNIGTGLRLSCLLNLYGLVSTKKIEEVVDNTSNIGYSLVNIDSEQGDSGLFLLFNIYSLGIPETGMITEFEDLLKRIKQMEMDAREDLFTQPDEVELSIEEIFEIKNKPTIEWSQVLYYISLIDALDSFAVFVKGSDLKRHKQKMDDLRNLVYDTTDEALLYHHLVEQDKLSEVRMNILRGHLSKIKYKAYSR